MYRQSRKIFTSRRKRPGRLIAIGLLIVLAVIGVYTAIDNGRVALRTQRVFSSSLPPSLEGFTVLHLSDLNGKRFGPGQKQFANALRNRKYNAVCITGDMVGPSGDVYPFIELLSTLDSSRPIFMISGDSDPMAIGGQNSNLGSPLADWILTAQQTRGVTFLGAPASMNVGAASVWFSDAAQLPLDLDEAAAAYAISSGPVSQYQAGVIQTTRAARAQMKSEDLHIVLTHKPLGMELLQQMQRGSSQDSLAFIRTVDMILAGSTTGGGWRLPLIGPLWADGWFPDDTRTYGFHYAGSVNMLQYISGGLGINPNSPLPPFRLFNTPEISLLTFTGQMDDGALPEM